MLVMDKNTYTAATNVKTKLLSCKTGPIVYLVKKDLSLEMTNVKNGENGNTVVIGLLHSLLKDILTVLLNAHQT